MRHIVHIMLGNDAESLLADLKRYVIKYGSADENSYFTALLYKQSGDAASFCSAEAADADESSFISGIENMFNISMQNFYEIPGENRTDYLKAYFTLLYNQHITINNPGDSSQLHLCLYVALYDAEYWALAKEMLQAIEAIEQEYVVDLFMLPYDLAFLLEQDADSLPVKMTKYQEQTKTTVDEILKAKKTFKSLEHLIMMQNCNGQGLSLDLDKDSFVRIIGEYALLTISHYQEIYPLNAQADDRPISALGLSVLSFDKYYFVQYLLHQAYIHILDHEQVLQEEVDVNKVSQIVEHILSKNVNVFSAFYDNYVLPRLNRHIDQDTIMTEIKPEWDAEILRLTDEFQSYIDNPSLSLPEKKATLAQLLGEDDELLTGYMFNRQQLVIDDCSREVLDLFVEKNNALFAMHETIETSDSETEKQRKQAVNAIADYACLSTVSGKPQTMPSEIIDNLKHVKVLMRESSNYIRLKSSELNAVNAQVDEHIQAAKRLTDKGFVFDGNTYILQDNKIEERPCEEDFVPRQTNIPSKVDLRKYFSPVRDQGELGACSSFATVAILEYILRKNKAFDSDLSEAFVYHYARMRETDKTDAGTSLYNNIMAIATEGVCLEKYCPYTATHSIEPSEEARNDALSRRIRKALNVQKDISHIRAAIAQGYPVAVSLRVFDSFEPIDGFIPRPTEQEINSNKTANHAMVLCGYSDDEKVFIVRNSWGSNFGENGYCYIPYSYITDFMNVACIITEINMDNIHVEGTDNTKTTISFDMSNSRIKTAILRNLIEEEKHTLSILNAQLQQYEYQYNKIFQALGNNATRTTLCDGTLQRLEYRKQQFIEQKNILEPERIEALRLFDRITLRTRIYYALTWLIPIAIYTLLLWPLHLNPVTVLFNKWSYIFYGILGLGAIIFILWNWQRKRKRHDLDQDYQQSIEDKERNIQKLNRELEITKLKTHVAGMIIDSLSKLFRNLHSKHNSMNSCLRNLAQWRHEEATDSMMTDQVKEPFLTLISNAQLQQYFQTCKQQITQSIKLYEMFRNSYKIEENEIIRFKNDLKKTLVTELFAKLRDYSIYKQISRTEHYPYAADNINDINSLLQQMDTKSQYFLRTLSTIDHTAAQNACCKLLFVDADVEATRQQWNSLCRNNFQLQPVCCKSDSHYKLTLIQVIGLAANEIAILE